MPKVKNDAPGMRGERSRNDNGELRKKRSDTHIGTIEQNYNIDLNVRSEYAFRYVFRKEQYCFFK